jgi:hypothetical protein
MADYLVPGIRVPVHAVEVDELDELDELLGC